MKNKTKRTIVLTEALSQLKLLDKKIDKKISQLEIGNVTLVDYMVGKVDSTSKGQKSLKTLSEIAKEGESFLDSLNDLIRNRNILKAKIAQANAINTVEINCQVYTIAEAIERKRLIETEYRFIQALRERLYFIKNEVSNVNLKAEETVKAMVESKLQSDSKNKNPDETKDLVENLYSLYKATLVDPNNIEKFIEEKEEELENFENQVDIALSIVNARVEIEVDF